MKVTVKFFAGLRDAVGEPEITIDLLEGTTAGALWDQCAVRFPGLGAVESTILTAVNREFAEAATGLRDGDEVAFLPPVSGGTDV